MPCPMCGKNSTVKDSRPAEVVHPSQYTSVNAIRRRRECVGCRYRWTTWETTGGDQRMFARMQKLLEHINHLRNSLDTIMIEIKTAAEKELE